MQRAIDDERDPALRLDATRRVKRAAEIAELEADVARLRAGIMALQATLAPKPKAVMARARRTKQRELTLTEILRLQRRGGGP
jgi:hypothetical protein